MTPQEIVDATLVPGTKRVFVLGSFEQRVTVYSQQVRALNLVDALLSLEMVRREGGEDRHRWRRSRRDDGRCGACEGRSKIGAT